MSAKPTPREIAAMKALPTAIKATNDAYTQGRLMAERIPATFNPKMDGFQLVGVTPDGCDLMTVALCTVNEADEANARRLAACWNVCEGIPTETLESCAHWSDIVKAPLNHRHHIPAEAAVVGAVLDPDSLEQGEPV